MKICFTLVALLPIAAWAQAPTISAISPARNASNAPRIGVESVSFSQAVNGASGLRVNSNQWHGYRAGIASGDGTATLSFHPNQAFAPGEAVSMSIPATVRGTGSAGLPLASGQVVQFQAAAGPAMGTFTVAQHQNVPSGQMAYPVLADINNDGNLDYFFIGNLGGTVEIYMGNGQGHFTAGTAVQVCYGTSGGLTLGDLNEDGNLDLVVAVENNSVYQVKVFNGDGSGGFVASAVLPNVGYALCPRVADVNADGHSDIVFLDHGVYPSRAINLAVFLGNGQGSFTNLPQTSLNSTALGGTLDVMDTNRDGRHDCVVGIGTQISSYLGDGAGNFVAVGTPVAVPAAAFPPATTLSDLTGDGIPELVYASSSANTVQVYAGTGTGGFAATPLVSLAVLAPQAVVAADVDGDGDMDLVVARNSITFNPSGNQSAGILYLNNGTGSFSISSTLAGTDNFPTSIMAGDVNNDGTMDIIWSDPHGDSIGPFFDVRPNTTLTTAPTISGFSTATGGTGTVVTITGTNFTGATTVLVGGVPITGFTVVNGNTITFILPASIPTGLVTVITPTGTGTSAIALRNALSSKNAAEVWPVTVYPNPASGIVNVVVPGMVESRNLEMLLYNSLGQLIHSYPSYKLPVAGLSTSLDVSGFSPGLYTLYLKAGTKAISCKVALE